MQTTFRRAGGALKERQADRAETDGQGKMDWTGYRGKRERETFLYSAHSPRETDSPRGPARIACAIVAKSPCGRRCRAVCASGPLPRRSTGATRHRCARNIFSARYRGGGFGNTITWCGAVGAGLVPCHATPAPWAQSLSLDRRTSTVTVPSGTTAPRGRRRADRCLFLACASLPAQSHARPSPPLLQLARACRATGRHACMCLPFESKKQRARAQASTERGVCVCVCVVCACLDGGQGSISPCRPCRLSTPPGTFFIHPCSSG